MMSLKSRLRTAILVLVVTIVLVLSALHVSSAMDETLHDVQERATLLGQQVKTYVLERLNEHAYPGDWKTRIAQDRVIARVLENSMSNASNAVEILITDENNRVLVSSLPQRNGAVFHPAEDFPNLAETPFWTKLRQVLGNTRNYSISVPLGTPDQPDPLFTIRILLSSMLIRNDLLPQLKDLAAVSIAALIVSIVLSIVASNLVSRSILSVGTRIERIAAGQMPVEDPDTYDDSKEMHGIQDALSRLSRVYHGAREDVIALRRNIDQLIQRLEEAVFVFDRDGVLQMAGESAERLLLRSHSDLVGRRMEDLFPSYSQLGAAIQNSVRMRYPIQNHPVLFDRPNLPQSRLLLTVELVGADGSQFAGILVTVKDAESRKQLQSQLDIANRLAAIGRLSSGVAHEIKNPLNGIALHLEVLRSRLNGADAETAEVISRELRRLDAVVKTFIEFNRPLEPDLRECNLVAVSRDAVSVATHRTTENVKLAVTAEVEQAPVLADPELTRQAVVNVLLNAIESMNSPGEVRLTLQQEDGAYVVNVSDQGCGIAPEIRDKIFNLYFTTKSSGGGIGLAMAFLVMQLHNGTIDFDSEVGRGSTFRLHFPALRNPEVH